MSEPLWRIGGDAVLATPPDRTTVWLVDIDEPPTRHRAEALALLPGEAAAMAGRHDAGGRLLRRRLARLLLAAAGRCHPDRVELDRTEAGAPVVIRPSGWHLSVGARWPLCAIGVARRPIGVDIEAIGAPLPDDLLTEAERKDGNAGAARWAAKEAHAKWTGRPRDLEPAAIETGGLPLVTSRFGATHCWLRGIGDHVAAVCTAA